MRRKFWVSWWWGMAVILATGCVSNLQGEYVQAMEATREAIQRDVEAGFYKPDKRSQGTLDAWTKANADARAVLEREGKIEPVEKEGEK